MKHRLSLAGAISLAALVVLLLFIGIQRYGSLDGLWRRASAEVTRAPAAPGPGADAAPDFDDPAYLGRDGLTADSAAVHPTFAGAVRHRDARAPAATPTAAATSSTPRPAASRTATSAATRSPTPTRPPPTFTPTPPPTALPPAVRLTGLTHAWQTWNNCGPATLAMNLSYFGSRTTQAEVAATLAAVQG